MELDLGDVAPNFEARTTLGAISFYDWIGDCWAVLFCHPRVFAPVSTTELGYLARSEAEFERRGVKIVALSVGRASSHERWARDIEAIEGCTPHFPIASDDSYAVVRRYGMGPADETIRCVLVIGPDKRVELILTYPTTAGHNFGELLRAIDSLQLSARGTDACRSAMIAPQPPARGERCRHKPPCCGNTGVTGRSTS